MIYAVGVNGYIVNRRQLSYPWARPYYPAVPRPPQPGGLLSFFAAHPPEPNPSLTPEDVERTLAGLWDRIGNDTAKTILMSHNTAIRFDRTLRIWGRIRRHARWSNVRRRQ